MQNCQNENKRMLNTFPALCHANWININRHLTFGDCSFVNAPPSESRFVVQRHQARTLHYDLRLERAGVFKSWAVPKGVPEGVGPKHLAIQVEEHSLDYGSSEGEIPVGQPGAGSVEIWDCGTYDVLEWSDDKIAVDLLGGRLQGQYDLVRSPKRR